MTFRLSAIALAIAGVIAIVLVAMTVAPSQSGESDSASQSDGSAPTLQFPVRTNPRDSLTYSLSLVDLVRESDVVLVGTVAGAPKYERSEVGTALTAVNAIYEMDAERYLKGESADRAILHYTVAYEDAESESAYYTDDAVPLKPGSRYVLALSYWDGALVATAEPFRFRLDDGIAVLESSSHEGPPQAFLSEEYPAKSEADLVAEIEELVAAGDQTAAR